VSRPPRAADGRPDATICHPAARTDGPEARHPRGKHLTSLHRRIRAAVLSLCSLAASCTSGEGAEPSAAAAHAASAATTAFASAATATGAAQAAVTQAAVTQAAASAPDPATSITPEEILEHIEVLASDAFEGREAGTPGERRAGKYIVSVLAAQPGLEPAGEDGSWFQPFPITLHGQPATARNIVARLPGTDPALKDQVIVVGAHYDHVGYGLSHNALDGPGQIHNGADDNASGSATLLDLATSLAGAHWAPRHTILFQWYSGEELGLLGSKYWVEHPLVPLDQTVFMINMDMVGRLVARTLVVGGTGTSPGLAELARGDCDGLGLTMIDDPPGTAPSDNTSFYQHGIPAMFLFTGLHEDYHKATDDAWKINEQGAADVGRLAQELLAQIDARDEPPPFTSAPGSAYMFRPALYTGAAFVDSPPDGPRVSVVIPGSPAAEAGLRAGQLVLELDGQAVADVRALEQGLARHLTRLEPLRFALREPGAAADAAARIVEVRPIVR